MDGGVGVRDINCGGWMVHVVGNGCAFGSCGCCSQVVVVAVVVLLIIICRSNVLVVNIGRCIILCSLIIWFSICALFVVIRSD